MTVAVTGATGFVGRHVVAALERRSVPVCATRLELRDPPDDAYARLGSPDVLIHLAWSGLPNYRSLHHFEDELPLQYRFLRRLIEAGLSKLVVAGTCFEYGMQSGPLREQMETRPTNPYGFAKDALRKQLEYLQDVHPFKLTWARLFYMYGDGQAAGSLLPQLTEAVGRGDRTFDMSGGEQLRDYLPVEDVADTLVALALADQDSGIVNVCSGRPISIRALVEGWIASNDWRIELNRGHYPYSDYEPMAFWGDRTKLNLCLASR